ncbi:TPA: hypothetical protein N0F65_010344 [Lagenidium giganteum]|uniref:Heat shock protein 70 n=1 Tax=Lagenidium giganteum TaxID=4803 RepID=A0AAV2Z2V0_9STRA|nr:TPA: hypothetical protein N0F65_010344 [Lagenidium giganteum]
MATSDSGAMRVFGIDFGSQRCVMAGSNGDVVLNELGGMTTATLVAFKGNERHIGESAVLSASTNPQNTVDYLNVLLGKPIEHVHARAASLPGQRVSFEHDAAGQVVAVVDYLKQQTRFSMEQLVGMLFGKLTEQIKKRVQEGESFHVNIAVPSAWTDAEKAALKKASTIAGMPSVAIIERDVALARCFHCKHPLVGENEPPSEANAEPSVFKHIMIVDMGHTSTSVTVVKLTPEGETVLAMESAENLGSENFDLRMVEHFKTELKAKHNITVDHHTKEGKRLFQACEKLKKLLSTINEAGVTVENIAQDKDITIQLGREVFEQLCASERVQLKNMLDRALTKSELSSADISSVEIVGGGTRIPFVQATIEQAVGGESGILGRMLDSTSSIAVGAAYYGRGDVDMEDVVSSEDEARLQELIALEAEMQERDANIAAIANERNAIEAFIYEMRSKGSSKHGSKIDSAQLNPILDAAEDWIYSEESENADLEQMRAKCQEFKAEVQACCKAYFEAVEADERVFEAELEAEAKKAEEERMAEGGDDDHDNRKLKKPERMRLVTKNKDEGNELFRDGNHQHAALRYIKALQHASKFFDLNEADKEEVNKLRVSLYLNLAQCYIKMQLWSKVIANCRDAILLDPTNPKAYYRRAFAYEKENDIEKAAQDIKSALSYAPEDKAILKFDGRLKLLEKKQLQKEKQMWSKAFA